MDVAFLCNIRVVYSCVGAEVIRISSAMHHAGPKRHTALFMHMDPLCPDGMPNLLATESVRFEEGYADCFPVLQAGLGKKVFMIIPKQ